MYKLLFSAAIEAIGGYGRVEVMFEGPYCFGGPRSFFINNIEKEAKFAVHSVHRQYISRHPNLIAESLYSENCVLQKEFGQPGPYPPACVKVLGRALTADEKLRLQEELCVEESNIQGNDINGCGKCWYANPNDDDVYTFTIPPSVMLKGALDVDYVTIDGSEVKLSTIKGGLKINCKELMSYVTMDFNHAANLATAMDRGGYQHRAVL